LFDATLFRGLGMESLMLGAAVVGEGDVGARIVALELLANNVWILVATVLVFAMHLGFACLESGLTRAKNTANILFKNTGIVAIGLLTYAFVGFNLMYPSGWSVEGWLATVGGSLFGIADRIDSFDAGYNASYTYWTDFIFQGMFAATAATIVSGAVAERVKLLPFLIFCVVFVSLVYPVVGSWKWGGGWLDGLDVPFYDLAGSTLVHSVGGWGALALSLIHISEPTRPY